MHVEKRDVNLVDTGVARDTIEELIKGPKTNLSASIPTGTKLLGINIKDDVAYVDFSKEFINNHSGGSAGELMTLYSISILRDFFLRIFN